MIGYRVTARLVVDRLGQQLGNSVNPVPIALAGWTLCKLFPLL